MIVLDASAIVELLLNSPTGKRVARLMRRASLHVPHLLDLEVVHVFRRLLQHRELTDLRAAQCIFHLRQLQMTRHAHEPLVDRIWKLRDRMSAYDAAYVVLAQLLRARLVTLDAKLARAAADYARVVVP